MKKFKIFLFLLSMCMLSSCSMLEEIIGGFLDIDSSSSSSSGLSYASGEVTIDDNGIAENIIYDDFSIHFLELGNQYSGDSIYIKAGDTDILIDAGSRKNSAATIEKYVDQYCTDGKLEYVITTHAHQDHIEGMVGNSKGTSYKGESIAHNGILYYYDVDTIIDFALNDATSNIYNSYVEAIAYCVENKNTKHYSASECFNNENGASSTYQLTDDISFTILYNYYYFNKSSDENNYSVCVLFTYKDYNFMFTGDLEKDGEEKLVSYYDSSTSEKTLPHCVLFKAGHHGSQTSSNDVLLNKITPSICVASCVAGSSEYTNNYKNIFPTQDFISRIGRYTSRVYVTSLFNEKSLSYESFNGTICISSNGTNVGIAATNNITKLKESTWFNEKVYVKDDLYICSGKGKTDFYTKDSENVKEVVRRIWPSF